MKVVRYKGVYRGPGYRKFKLIGNMCFSVWEGIFLISQNKR